MMMGGGEKGASAASINLSLTGEAGRGLARRRQSLQEENLSGSDEPGLRRRSLLEAIEIPEKRSLTLSKKGLGTGNSNHQDERMKEITQGPSLAGDGGRVF